MNVFYNKQPTPSSLTNIPFSLWAASFSTSLNAKGSPCVWREKESTVLSGNAKWNEQLLTGLF